MIGAVRCLLEPEQRTGRQKTSSAFGQRKFFHFVCRSRHPSLLKNSSATSRAIARPQEIPLLVLLLLLPFLAAAPVEAEGDPHQEGLGVVD